MVEFLLFIIAMVSGMISTHFNCKIKGTTGFKYFIVVCFGASFFATIVLFSFLAPIWVSYSLTALWVLTAINNISEFRKSVAK